MDYNPIPAGYDDEFKDDDFLEADFAQNLKITVVPDTITIGACLNGEDFDSQLSEDIQLWFLSFRERWNAYKRSPSVTQDLKLTLLNDPSPLYLALKIFANCPGCTNLKNKNLALYLLETVCELKKQRPNISDTLDDNTRMVAFNFVKTCGITSLYKSVIEAYELLKIKHFLVAKLHELLSQGYLKEVALWSINLQLTNEFGIFEIVFPLILLDKVYVAEEYLSVAKNLQLPTVKFLDTLLDKHGSVFENAYEILAKHKYANVNHSILSYRPISKLVARLAKNYNIPSEQIPNLNYTKTCKYLRHLYLRYQEGAMSCDSWRELVPDSATTKSLQKDLLCSLVSYGDIDEAAYWGNYFKLEKGECSTTVYDRMLELQQQQQEEEQQQIANSVIYAQNAANEYLQFSLPDDCIVLVDEPQKFLDMLNYMNNQNYIAFDSEWKPSVTNDSVVSLLQLATIERVYLLDCESQKLQEEYWKLLGQQVFNNLEILKIGFSLEHDIQMLQKSLPMHLNLSTTSCYLDLRKLWRRLKYMQIVVPPLTSESFKGESLSSLAEICLGHKLDKSNQCSNWSNRPLRRDQIIYAALDAHCLLQIYQFLEKTLKNIGIDLEQVVEEMTTSKTGYLVRLRQEEMLVNKTENPTTTVQNVDTNSTTKFICDTMLAHLTKELRKLGVDCVDIQMNGKMDYIDIAKREQRIILTRNERYIEFMKVLPKSQCLQIPEDAPVNQLLAIIQLFEIKIHEQNLYTRCLHCNSKAFILMNRNEMHFMRFGYELPNVNEDQARRDNKYHYLYKKSFTLITSNGHVLKTRRTFSGVPVKVNRIKPKTFRFCEHFYICNECGSISWDGAYGIHHTIMKLIEKQDSDLGNDK